MAESSRTETETVSEVCPEAITGTRPRAAFTVVRVMSRRSSRVR